MTRKQLQVLISAGVFSAALLSGAAYADDSNPQPKADATTPAPAPDAKGQATTVGTDPSTPANTDSSNAQGDKKTASTDKSPASSGCAGAGGCGGGK
jgi:hypothetical protein